MIDITRATNNIKLATEALTPVLPTGKKSTTWLIFVCLLILTGILLYLYFRDQQAKKAESEYFG